MGFFRQIDAQRERRKLGDEQPRTKSIKFEIF
jgi:hypothetical protein